MELLISSSTFTRLEDLAIRRCLAWSHAAFMRMAERSMLHDTLRALTLSNVGIGFADLLQVLRLLARVTTLRVCDPSLDEATNYAPLQLNASGLLAALTMSSAAVTSELLLPHLEIRSTCRPTHPNPRAARLLLTPALPLPPSP